jgi:hypothetical protein
VFTASGSVHSSCCRLVSWMSWNFSIGRLERLNNRTIVFYVHESVYRDIIVEVTNKMCVCIYIYTYIYIHTHNHDTRIHEHQTQRYVYLTSQDVLCRQ